MDAYIPEEKKKDDSQKNLTLIIIILAAAVLFQFIYFSAKLKSVKKASQENAQKTSARETYAIPKASSANRPAPNSRLYSAAFPPVGNFFSEDPLVAFERLHNRIYQMMNAAQAYAPAMMQQMQQSMGSDFMPAVDLEETPAAYLVKCDIPGLDKDKINITTRNNILTIQGVRETSSQNKDEQSGFYSMERSYGTFARSIPLPGPVNEGSIKADYKDGVLTVTLPKEKGAEVSTKKIPVQ